jgi:hypothetical protein
MTVRTLSNSHLRVDPCYPAFSEALKQLVTISSQESCAPSHLAADAIDTMENSSVLRAVFIAHMRSVELARLEQSRRVVGSALQRLETFSFVPMRVDHISDWMRVLNEARHKLFAEHSFSDNEMTSQLDETHSSANTPLFKYRVYSFLLEQLVNIDAQRLFSGNTAPTTLIANYSSSSMTTTAP